MNRQAWAIVWAQWRTLANVMARGGDASLWLSIAVGVIWYGLWAFASIAIVLVVRDQRDPDVFSRFLGGGLLLSFLYWQLIPVLMVSTGASLELKRLRVYPIPRSQLFTLEVLLRISTGIEMVLLMLGAVVGLALNPVLPVRYAWALLPFMVFNLFLAAGLRDVLTRLMAWRRFHELAVLVLVLIAALPQFLIMSGAGAKMAESIKKIPIVEWPWSATARLVSDTGDAGHVVVILLWLTAAYAFGRTQFERGLRFDEAAARARSDRESGIGERLFRIPSMLFNDPIGAMVEKELRTLIRSPRFRLVFLMGFSFSLLIWLPMAFGEKSDNGNWMQARFLVILFTYALMLLGEVAIWNVFGFDRSAASLYWAAPVKPWQVLAAKNAAAALFALVEMAIITLVCMALRLPVTPGLTFEAFAVAGTMLLLLVSMGNLSSVYFPRASNPNQSWKGGAARRFQILLLVLYPAAAAPFAIAYLLRGFWGGDAVFFLLVALTFVLAVAAYWVSLRKSVIAVSERKERVLAALAWDEGPISS